MAPFRDSLTTDTSLAAADRIRDWLEGRLRACGVGAEDAAPLLLASSEIATNIARHAYRGDPSGSITVGLEVGHDRVRLTLGDQGVPFDRGGYRAPDLGLVQEGGYGIYLVERLMDQVIYEPAGASGNKVVLIKKRGRADRL